jgi:ankyrin repeat protein
MKTLHEIVQAGDVDALVQQLENGAAVDARDDRDRTPLMAIFDEDTVADEQTSIAMMRVLLSYGADCNAVKSELGSMVRVLTLAVRSGTLAQIEFLLEAGADASYQDENGYNVLIYAMNARSRGKGESLLPLLELLLAHGAPVNGESDWGESALSISSHNARFDVVKRLLQAGADGDVLEWTPLMFFIALGDTATVEQLLRAGANLEARDGWERTPFLLSLETGDVEKAKLLLEAGSDLNQRSRCGKTALMHAIESGQPEMFAWLIAQGADLNAQDEFGETALMKAAEDGATEFVRQLIEAGVDIHLTNATEQRKQRLTEIRQEMNLDLPASLIAKLERNDLPGATAINKAANLDIVRLLVAAGADLNDISDEMRAELTGLETEGELVCSEQSYWQEKYRRFGSTNPELMNCEFWKAMVRSGEAACGARVTFGDDENFEDEAVWSFYRFGKSITELPDGRIIEIGGEHEDSYDTDFCIYNDVFVHHGNGRFDIYGYPESVFPPTDFHTATLVGDVIYIIGCLGYDGTCRSGETPVYKLHCDTLQIEAVATSGDKPGWINSHKAIYSRDSQTDTIYIFGGKVIQINGDKEEYLQNTKTYCLDLSTMVWECIEK